MATRKLERCGLEQYAPILASVGIVTVKDILEESPLRLLQLCDISMFDLQMLLNKLCEFVAPKPRTALEIHRERSMRCCYIPSGLNLIDNKLRGGLPYGSIAEVCGPPGIGKTQFCMNVCLRSVLPALAFGQEATTRAAPAIEQQTNGSVVYIDTELKFDSNRILEIARSLPVPLSTTEAEGVLKKVDIFRPTTCKELLELVETTLQNVIIENGVQLVVIDSIAALAKKENLNEADKEHYIVRLAGLLKEIGDESNCCILITNQVSLPSGHGQVQGPGQGQSQSLVGENVSGVGARPEFDGLCDHIPLTAGVSSRLMKASLGSIWHHCVSTRLMLYFDEAAAAAGDTASGGIVRQRMLAVTKSPVSEHCSVGFEITTVGLREI